MGRGDRKKKFVPMTIDPTRIRTNLTSYFFALGWNPLSWIVGTTGIVDIIRVVMDPNAWVPRLLFWACLDRSAGLGALAFLECAAFMALGSDGSIDFLTGAPLSALSSTYGWTKVIRFHAFIQTISARDGLLENACARD
jgi:hypothetical protein